MVASADLQTAADDLLVGFREFNLPERMFLALCRYVVDGVRPGDFLQAVLANDLRSAVGCADDENTGHLANWSRVVYQHVPSNANGSHKIVQAWIDKGGLAGKPAEGGGS